MPLRAGPAPARLLVSLAVLALLLPFSLGACGDDDDEMDTPVPTVTPSPTVTPRPTTTSPASDTPVQPTPERTPRPSGGALIDAVIESVEAQDAEQLQGLLHYFLMACTGNEGIGAIPCPTGQPVGSTVQAFGIGGCEGTFFLQGDPGIPGALAMFLETERELYAVAVTAPFPGDERIPGEYMVVFRNVSGPLEPGDGSAVAVAEDGVTYLVGGCGLSPEELTRGSTEYLIPPQN